jgi:hypothetical protein
LFRWRHYLDLPAYFIIVQPLAVASIIWPFPNIISRIAAIIYSSLERKSYIDMTFHYLSGIFNYICDSCTDHEENEFLATGGRTACYNQESYFVCKWEQVWQQLVLAIKGIL